MLPRWTCKRSQRLLGPYSENALPERKAAVLAAHLAACPACRAELAALRQMARLLRAHKPPAPEPARDLWSRIQAEITRPAPRRAPARPAVLSLGAAAAALLVFALFRPPTQTEPASSAASRPAAAPAIPAPPLQTAEASPAPAGVEARPTPITPRPERRAAPRRSRPEPARPERARPERARVAAAPKPLVRRVARDHAPRRARSVGRQETRLVLVRREPAALSRDRDLLPPGVRMNGIRASEDAPASPIRTLAASAPAVEEVAPPAHVSASASAVDEALDVERRNELFRYSRLSSW